MDVRRTVSRADKLQKLRDLIHKVMQKRAVDVGDAGEDRGKVHEYEVDAL